MNPFTLIGFFLMLFCATKYVNAVPVASDSAITSDNASAVFEFNNGDGKLDNLLHNAAEMNTITESVQIPQTTTTTTSPTTTRRPANKPQKSKPKRPNPKHIKHRRAQPDCRFERPSNRVKPAESGIQMPSIFISTGWGPGR